MQERPPEPKGPNPWEAEVPGPEPAPQDPADEATGPDSTDQPDDAGLLIALRRLQERRGRHRDLIVGGVCGVLGLIIGLAIGAVNTTAAAPGPVSATAGAGDRGVPTGAATQTPGAQITTTVPDPVGSGVVTMTVTGSAPDGIDITYGTNSSTIQNTRLPFVATLLLDSSGTVTDYDLTARLQGSGKIACSIAVNGAVLQSGTASGGHNTCSAEIDQNPVTHKWQEEQVPPEQ